MLKPLRAACLIAAASLLLALAPPAARPAAAAETQAAPAQSATPGSSRVEKRIQRVHSDLKITPDQENLWGPVAQAMRDDSQAMRAEIQKRKQSAGKLSAVDEMRSYAEMQETHLQGLQKLIPPFQALYDSMSPEQKQIADAMFAHRPRHRMRHAPAKAQ